MSTNKKIQILVATHKPAYIPKNRLLLPMRLGAALGTDNFGYQGDDSGDNISEKNASYCELTAIYWAWKNLKVDYVGLFHYRRYLSFAKDQDKTHDRAYPTIYDGLEQINLDESYMENLIGKYDVIIPRLGFSDGTIREQYADNHYIKDLDDCLEYIDKKYPEVAKYSKTLDKKTGYFYNMFIMRRDLFDAYCEFIFDVLGNFDKTHDLSEYDVQQYRVDGYLAERLTNMYLHYLKSKQDVKFKELQVAYFENTDPKTELKPVAKTNNIAIALAANDFYLPYISTLIHSIADHSSKSNTYDINIFHRDITAKSQDKLRNEFLDQKNISLRFVNMLPFANAFKDVTTHIDHISIETYFRIFIPDVMSDYDKVLYLDGDLVANTDVAELYNEKIGNNIFAAVRDYDMAGVYNSNSVKANDTIDPTRKKYIDNVLKLKKPYDYFQAGVLLFNLDAMRKELKTDEIIKFASSRKWDYMDQDVLNYFAQGKVKSLDPSWNVLFDNQGSRIKDVIVKAPREMYSDYMKSRKHPKIIHYGGFDKPWLSPEADFAELFWKYARQSVYYEVLIKRMCSGGTTSNVRSRGLKGRMIAIVRKLVNKYFPHGTAGRERIHKTKIAIKKVIGR